MVMLVLTYYSADFAAPFTITKDVSKASCDEGSINMIESMGFTRSQAVAALQATVGQYHVHM